MVWYGFYITGMAFIPRNGLLDTIEIKQGKEEKDYVQYINQITDFLEC